MRRKFYYFPLFLCLVKIPIQIFWTVIVFTIQIFLTIVFGQVFCLFHSTNFEFLSGMLLPRNLNGSSSFYKGPRTCKNYYSHLYFTVVSHCRFMVPEKATKMALWTKGWQIFYREKYCTYFLPGYIASFSKIQLNPIDNSTKSDCWKIFPSTFVLS